jgi:hypothetical protein
LANVLGKLLRAKSRFDFLILFKDDAPVGTARLVNFIDNSRRKREGSAKPAGKSEGPGKDTAFDREIQKTNTISYSSAMGGEEECSHNTSV